MRSTGTKQNFGKIDQAQVKQERGELVRGTVEETLNTLLAEEADRLCGAKRYERNAKRKDYRCGKRKRSLETKAGKVELQVPKLRTLPFESAIIERSVPDCQCRKRYRSVQSLRLPLAGGACRPGR